MTARSLSRIVAAALVLVTGGLAAATGTRESRLPRLRFLKPFPAIRQRLSPVQTVVPAPNTGYLMGRVCAPVSPAHKGQ